MRHSEDNASVFDQHEIEKVSSNSNVYAQKRNSRCKKREPNLNCRTEFYQTNPTASNRPVSNTSVHREIMAIQAAQACFQSQQLIGPLEAVDLRARHQNQNQYSSLMSRSKQVHEEQGNIPVNSEDLTTSSEKNEQKQNGRRDCLKFGIDNILKAQSKHQSTTFKQTSGKSCHGSVKSTSKMSLDPHREHCSSSESCQESDDCGESTSPLWAGSLEKEETVKRLTEFFAEQYRLLHHYRQKDTSLFPLKPFKFHPYADKNFEQSTYLPHPVQTKKRERLEGHRRSCESPSKGTFPFAPIEQHLPLDRKRSIRDSAFCRLSLPEWDKSPSTSLSSDTIGGRSQVSRRSKNTTPIRTISEESEIFYQSPSSEDTDKTLGSRHNNLLSPSEPDDVFTESPINTRSRDGKLGESRVRSRSDCGPVYREVNPFLKVPENILQAARSTLASPSALPLLSVRQLPLSAPSSASPKSPLSNNFSAQTWQALAANYHSSLRYLMYPYAYCNSSTAAAVAIAAARSSMKATPPATMERITSSSSSPTHNNSFEEKKKIPKKRRKWSRAVFSLVQRRGLEKSFQMQKYVAKPERRGLAEALGLTDAQVKIWFQNRRMKWRQELKNAEKHHRNNSSNSGSTSSHNGCGHDDSNGQLIAQSC